MYSLYFKITNIEAKMGEILRTSRFKFTCSHKRKSVLMSPGVRKTDVICNRQRDKERGLIYFLRVQKTVVLTADASRMVLHKISFKISKI